MEKNSPHYALSVMQQAIAAVGHDAFTQTALAGGRDLGLTVVDMLAVIAGLSRSDFYKSMTTHNDHRVWQDVYHADCPTGQVAYIKLTAVAERIVIQFKGK